MDGKYGITVIVGGIVLVILIFFGSLVKGCEQVELTNREKIKLEMVKVENQYQYEKVQTNTTKVGPATNQQTTTEQVQR